MRRGKHEKRMRRLCSEIFAYRCHKFILAIGLLCLSLMTMAQSKAFDELYKKHSNTRGIESRRIGRVMLAAARVATGNDIPKGLTGVRILSIQDRSVVAAGIASTLNTDIRGVISSLPVRLIKEDESDDHEIKIYGQPAGNDKYRDIIMYVTGSAAIFVMELAGEFDSSDIAKMSMRNE